MIESSAPSIFWKTLFASPLNLFSRKIPVWCYWIMPTKSSATSAVCCITEGVCPLFSDTTIYYDWWLQWCDLEWYHIWWWSDEYILSLSIPQLTTIIEQHDWPLLLPITLFITTNIIHCVCSVCLSLCVHMLRVYGKNWEIVILISSIDFCV